MHPSYIESLRAEWEQALETADGKMTERSLSQLYKMDSFLRESQRLSPAVLLSIKRYLTLEVVLSNGQILPRGSFISIPLYAMNRDPDIFPEPDKFNGQRFLGLRNEEEDGKERNDGTTTTKWGLLDLHPQVNINFGNGKHTCPGRFLAVNEVCTLLANLRKRRNTNIGLVGETSPRSNPTRLRHPLRRRKNSTAQEYLDG